MPRRRTPLPLTQKDARRIWLRAQRLDAREPFGAGPSATLAAVAHLGYVQIDTIHVIERSHHHILYTRIPAYRRDDLRQAQSVDKSVFEYWAHALAYIPTRDFRFFMREMRRQRSEPKSWFGTVTDADVRKALRRVRKEGALTIRDIDDDVLVDKNHPWASRKPTKRALQAAFHMGLVTISARAGMLKTYELPERHFGWNERPRMASEGQIDEYVLDRALRAQGVVSLDSVCYMDAPRKPAMRALIERRVRRNELVALALEGAEKIEHWAPPGALEERPALQQTLVHILSPFDPLIIQRKRLRLLFGYDHVFEAYVPQSKRRFGYFALPVLVGDEIVAAIDLKTDRENRKLMVQKWTWVGRGGASDHKKPIEEEMHRFERFQLGAEG
jgi:uncharacterized protein YcaQ